MNKLLACCPKLAAIATILLGSITPCRGQAVAASDQTQSEPSTARVDHLFAQWDKPDSPGCSVGVSRAGQLLYEHGYGAANVELHVPITPATVFHAASVAKLFTAMSVMLLAERGKLSLDDDVRKYLPEFPEYHPRLTIRHLLSHTAGLRDVFELQALAAPGPGSRDPNDQFVNLLAHQRELNFEPGSEWQYSNGGYLLLATIVKRVSGESLREFAAANIFGPLGMKDTRFHDDATEIIPNRSSGYSPGDSGIRVATGADPGGIVGNAGLFTTARDLLRWADNWDRVGIGSRAMLDAMATPTMLPDGYRAKYGLGLELGEYRGTHTVGHSGGNSGFVARVVRYQEQKLAVAILCNRDDMYNVDELADEVAEVYFPKTASSSNEQERTTSSPRVQLSAEELTSKEGLYQNPSNQQLLRVFADKGKLMAGFVGRSNAWDLTAVSSTRFTMLGGLVTLEFLPDNRRQTQEIRVTDNETPRPFLIHRVNPRIPSPSDLPVFAGNYRSEELEVTYTVAVDGSALKIRIPGRDDIFVQPVAADTFAGQLVGVMKFSGNSSERVSGFTVNTTGVRGLRFERLKGEPWRTAP
jgi:CubicO group peptidase (beta-lactamase class C family)